MKHGFVILMVAVLAATLGAPPLFAQATTTVKGVCKDLDGKPYAAATVELSSTDTGRKYSLKTNGKGEYFSIGIASGEYKVTLISEGKVIYVLQKVPVTLDRDENVIDIDMKKEQGAAQQQMSPEDRKKLQEQQEKIAKDQAQVKSLNDLLAGARAATQAGNFEEAARLMTQATTADPNRDLLWFTLAEAQRGQGKGLEKTDRAAAQTAYQQAIASYQKAIAIKPVSAYYNNMGEVLAMPARPMTRSRPTTRRPRWSQRTQASTTLTKARCSPTSIKLMRPLPLSRRPLPPIPTSPKATTGWEST